jgi:hypothetical protein
MDSRESIPPDYIASGWVRQVGLSYLPTRLAGKESKSIPGLLKRLQIWAQGKLPTSAKYFWSSKKKLSTTFLLLYLLCMYPYICVVGIGPNVCKKIKKPIP